MINNPLQIDQILKNIDTAISKLLKNEIDSLVRGIKEENISGFLTSYLRPLFAGYDVDQEYNGDWEKPNDRKALQIAKGRIIKVGKSPNKWDIYKLTPDIIIHERKNNDNNLVVIEEKKDTNSKNEKEFDLVKLEHLTIDYLGNHYNYDLGVAIVFGTGKNNAGKYGTSYFQNGIPKERNELT